MSRRVRFLLCVLVVGLLAGAVSPAVAQDGQVTVSADDIEVGTDAEGHSVTVSNNGGSDVDVDVTVDSSPSGIAVTPSRQTVTVPANSQREVDVQIDADDDAGGGTVAVSAGGDTADFEVTRPAIAGFADEPLDLGDVLVGERTSDRVAIEELTGDGSLSDVDVSIVNSDLNADMEVSATGDAMDWAVSVDDGVDQHRRLSWTVELVPNDNPDAARTVDVEARVIYPAAFGEVALDDEITFDEPRESASTITKTVELEVENAGDLPLELDSVTAHSSTSGIDVEAVDEEVTIDGQRQLPGTVELAVTADTALEEGEYAVSGSLSSANRSAGTASYDGIVTVEHGTALDVPSRIDMGDVPIGETDRRSTTVAEALGYNDVDSLEVTLRDGPDDWMTIEESPSSLAAGESQPVVFRAAFDTDAELGTTYEWTYVVDGRGVDEETVTVVASPVPLDFGPIREDVAAHDGSVAEGTLTILDAMDAQMRDGDLEGDEITNALSFGRASALYLEAMADATDSQERGEYDAAQTDIVQAAAAYNTMTLYGDEIDLSSDDLATTTVVLTDAETDLEAAIERQADHYRERLDSENVSLIEEATISRQLSRVALLRGDEERAATLEQDAEATFEEYTEAVSTGERARQRADETWATMEAEQFVTVAGQPLFLNPAEYDAYTDRVEEMNDAYENATATFEEAGETGRAEAVAAQHQERTDDLRVTRWSLFGAVAAYAAIVLGVVARTARGMYRYLRDARESVTGDFLV